jgi:thymidine phosphorylase
MSDSAAAALIRLKREGREYDASQLAEIAHGIAEGRWSEGQVGAFAMAVAWQGMGAEECRRFTLALRDSGRRLRWHDLPGPALDKHSTGGVGDAVSLLLAPLVAACGGYVPMISGRGLGHTGGTLDKLQSLHGYDIQPSPGRLQQVVREVGCAIVGQSDDLVPADRMLYAVRDVTATVDVLPLIVASILSKKLAGGAAALVMDIKVGNGAQTPEPAQARRLAEHMLAVGTGGGLRMRVMLSDMHQVLGRDAGNAIEVRAVLDLLCGRVTQSRLLDLALAQSAELLCLGGLASDGDDAASRVRAALASGAAAERFARMVAALGGPRDLLEHPARHLPEAPIVRAVPAERSGVVHAVDVRALGEAVVDLGGGRRRPQDEVDPAVGLTDVLGLGDAVAAGEALAIVHAPGEAEARRAEDSIRRALVIGDGPTPLPALHEWL